MVTKVPCLAIVWFAATAAHAQIHVTAAADVDPDTATIMRTCEDLSTFSPLTNRSGEAPTWYEMFSRLPGDWVQFGENNFRADRIPAFAGVAGLTAALMLADNNAWQATDHFSNRTPASREITHSFALLGDGRTVLALAGGFAIAGWTSDDNRALRTASQLVESYLSCGLTVQLLKHVTGRERPERQTRPGGEWRPFPNQKEYHRAVPKFDAFPSGHVSSAMAMVTVLVENYPEAAWLRPVGYSAVGLVAFGLVSKGWHWYSDFPLAITLGYQFGRIAARPRADDERAEHSPAQSPQLSVTPALSFDGAGIIVALTF